MKAIMAVCVCALVVLEAKADFKMPKAVYRMDRLEEAKTNATAKNRAITIIYTREKTTCGLCEAASLNAAKTLGQKTVVVYVNCDDSTERKSLPEAVQKALNSPEAGRFVPKTVIVDAGLNNVLAIVPYAADAEYKKLLKEAIKKLAEASAKPDLKKNTRNETPTAPP